MNIVEAFLLAVLVAVLYAVFIGGKLMELDFSSLDPKNQKGGKYRRLMAQRATPLEGMGLRRNIRKAFERVLLPLSKADEKLLPVRMDLTFRRNTERQLELLKRRQLCRDIRLIDVVPIPQNDFERWNDDGREWREATLECSALERFVPKQGGRPVYEHYRQNASVRILQSRHIRSSDRTDDNNNSYYTGKLRIACPSCGAQVELRSQQTVCPYCGGLIQSDFYDWQTETFEIHEKMGSNLAQILLLLGSTALLFVCTFLCFGLIKDTEVSLAAGVGTAAGIVAAMVAFQFYKENRQRNLAGKIASYSENYLRSCIHDVLCREEESLLEQSVGTIRLKRVVNTEETTKIRVRVCLSDTYLPKSRRPYTKKYKRTLTLQRARNPEQRKDDGSFFTEKDCPSCGANFVPDENYCCSFCGYGLQVSNAKWVRPESGK